MLKYLIVIFIFSFTACGASSLLIPMDGSQKDHLKAYGIAYYILKKGLEVDWLLNYRGGSFMITWNKEIEDECVVRGVTFERVSEANANTILKEISSPSVNMNVVRLERAPRIAVYSPKNELILDETDAVILVLEYAEIPYNIIYDEEVLKDELAKYDWLHLHHEDFTGQYGRFLRRESSKIEADIQQATAHRLGYTKVSAMKLDVAKRIKAFCSGGGYLFAMCSGAETFDIALAADGVDINESIYDGDEPDPEAQQKLDFTKTFAFENFTLEPGYSRRFSDINTGRPDFFDRNTGFFDVFQFSAKWDIIPSILTQNHEHVIREFHGQTTAFSKYVVKPTVLILGENRNRDNVRYIYGEQGRGHWTFYSGHDPEGSPSRWREGTDLSQHPNSPGYRLILNNVLFPSAKRKKMKT
ncbi:asparagine synthetase B [Fulvivirgaceae bacterium PWU4]|uniref:Asparagine synthetase B n=1 Tax=Chryseosolibacter histidini TaxID=2782349 RepID=A0AAP2DS00_9BACT|nr:asparagine synthetase B [Chryseosolibacter histidini]MBT1701441.1 asparagine synthetase B [Chryseosolibacter histidini]